jgi:hypothetical protein
VTGQTGSETLLGAAQGFTQEVTRDLKEASEGPRGDPGKVRQAEPCLVSLGGVQGSWQAGR